MGSPKQLLHSSEVNILISSDVNNWKHKRLVQEVLSIWRMMTRVKGLGNEQIRNSTIYTLNHTTQTTLIPSLFLYLHTVAVLPHS